MPGFEPAASVCDGPFPLSSAWTWACVDGVSLAPDSLCWGVLTVFVRAPKRLLEWPVCRQGGWCYAFIPSPPGLTQVRKRSVTGNDSSLLPLQMARFVLMVGGISNRSFVCVCLLFFFNDPEYPSGFPAALAVQHAFDFQGTMFGSVTGQMWWGQHYSSTRVTVETAAN